MTNTTETIKLVCNECGHEWEGERYSDEFNYEEYTCPECGGYEGIFEIEG